MVVDERLRPDIIYYKNITSSNIIVRSTHHSSQPRSFRRNKTRESNIYSSQRSTVRTISSFLVEFL